MNDNLAKLRANLTNRNAKVHLLTVLFGIGSWIGVHSVFVQLPLIVPNAPEGWALGSHVSMAIQLANIGPLMYTLFQKFSPRKLNDGYIIYFVKIIGFIACLIIAFLYQNTVILGDRNRSVALLVLVFFLAVVGCMSSVLFMPYMGRFREIYLITYLSGEALSGFLTSVVGLIQGVGGAPECKEIISNGTIEYLKYREPARFETRDFFLFVSGVMLISSIAFVLLNTLKMCKKEYVAGVINFGNEYLYDRTKKSEAEEIKDISSFNYKYLLVLMGVINLIGGGIFPGIQAFSCLSYGYMAYHLTVTLTLVANLIACVLAIFVKHTSIRQITLSFGVSFIISVYLFLTAVKRSPFFVGTNVGPVLAVVGWTFYTGLNCFIKLSITSVMRSQGGRSLVWVGAIGQAGSSIGSLVIFFVINFTHFFVEYVPSCPF